MCSCENAEPLRCSVLTEPVARKEHRCDECNGPIGPGQKYWRLKGVDSDGDAFAHKRCSACVKRARAFNTAEGCKAPLGALFDSIRECGEEDPDFDAAYQKALLMEDVA